MCYYYLSKFYFLFQTTKLFMNILEKINILKFYVYINIRKTAEYTLFKNIYIESFFELFFILYI
jgi:hypothetical protein